MPGIYSWLSDQVTASTEYVYSAVNRFISPVTTRIYQAIDTIYSVKYKTEDAVSRVASSPTTKRVTNNVHQASQGFMQAANFPKMLFAYWDNANLRRVMNNSLVVNVATYVAMVYTYESYRSFAREQFPYYEDSWPEYGVDKAFEMLLLSRAFSAIVTNAINLVSFGTATSEVVPTSKGYPTCKHVAKEPELAIKANIMGGLYYWVKQGMVASVNKVPVVGGYVALPAKIFVDGEALTEAKLSRLCANERNAVLVRNQAYSFGAGAGYHASVFAANWAIKRSLGVESPYIYIGLANFLWLVHSLAATLEDKPLPGVNPGVDYFSYPRLVTDRAVADATKTAEAMLSGPQGDLLQRLQAAYEYKAVRLLRGLVLPTSLSSLRGFMQRTSSVTFLQMHKEKIQGAIDELRSIRSSNGVLFYNWLGKHNDLLLGYGKAIQKGLVDKKQRKILENVLLDRNFRAWLQEFETYFHKVIRYTEMAGQRQPHARIMGGVVRTFDDYSPNAATLFESSASSASSASSSTSPAPTQTLPSAGSLPLASQVTTTTPGPAQQAVLASAPANAASVRATVTEVPEPAASTQGVFSPGNRQRRRSQRRVTKSMRDLVNGASTTNGVKR